MAVTPLLYATATSQPSGTWTNPANATGAPNSVYATWVNAVSGATASLAGQGFDVASMVPAGSTITSITATIKSYVSSATNISGLTARLYTASTTIGAAVTLTRSTTTTNVQTISFPTMPTAAQLAANDFRVRVIPVRAANTTSSTYFVDSIGITVTYDPPPINRVDVESIASLKYRWRADSIAGVADGAAVATWPALAGGVDLSQGTAANRPTYLASGPGGKPALKFVTASGQYLKATLAATAQPLTIFIVHQLARTDATIQELADFSGVQMITLAPNYDVWAGGTDVTGGTLTTNPAVLTMVANGASSKGILNGTPWTGNAGTGGLGATFWLGQSSALNRALDGTVSEVLVFSSALSADELGSVHSYIQDRYGITVADFAPPTSKRIQTKDNSFYDGTNTPAQLSLASGTLTTPATAGNLLVAAFSIDKLAGTFDTPAGWTKLADVPGASVSLLVLGKVAAGGETSVTATWSTATRGGEAFIAEYANAGLAFGPTSVPPYSDTAVTSMSVGPVTPTSAAQALFIVGNDSADTASSLVPTASGWTGQEFGTPTASGRPGLALAERNLPLAAGETLPATTFNWTNLDQSAGALITLVAAPAAPTTVTGDGALTSSPATVAGSGTLKAVGAGAVAPTKSTLGGSGAVKVVGAGGLTATPATVAGSGSIGPAPTTGTGALAPTKSTLGGSGTLKLVGAGGLTATKATVAGSGALRLDGAGGLTASKPTVAASVLIIVPRASVWTGSTWKPIKLLQWNGTAWVEARVQVL